MHIRSTTKKIAASAAIAASVVSFGAGAALAGPFDDFDPKPPAPIPIDKPFVPVPTAPPSADTDERPIFRSAGCALDAVFVDFHDPDGSDLRMTVEIGFYEGRGGYQVHTMSYDKTHDAWIATVPEGAKGVVTQATDEDGTYSLGVHLRPSSSSDCSPREGHFNNDQDVDIFGPEAINAR